MEQRPRRQLERPMKFNEGSIAKIVSCEGESRQFRGTGFLVTKNHVVTCWHVFPTHYEDETVHLELHFGRQGDPAAIRNGKLVAFDLNDLALIELEIPAASEPLFLISNLTQKHETVLSRMRGTVDGFSQPAGVPAKRSVKGAVTFHWNSGTQQLLSIQVEGALSYGMSGSPLIVESGGFGACMGIARLGGDGAARSSFIGPQVLLDFVAKHNISPRIILATDWLAKARCKKARAAVFIALGFLMFVASIGLRLAQAPDSHAQSDKTKVDNIKIQTQFLLPDQARYAIDKALEKPDIKEAIRLVSGMNRGEAKSDECDRLYNFARKGGMLEDARKIVNECWPGPAGKARLSEINTDGIEQ